MAPIPPSRRRGYQFRADELKDFLDIVESFLPILVQNWQAIADIHLENYHQEARTAESLHCKFQEIACRTGPTGDPNCPPYVIKAKQINRQLVQMIDASSGGLEAKRSEDGLSDASDSEDTGVGEFDNVINDMNNAAGNGNGGGEEVDEEEDADEGQPDAAGNGVAAAVVAGYAPPDGVAPAVARPRGRGPGRSHTLPASVAGVVCPPPAARTPPAAAVAAPCPAAGVAAPPAAAVVARNSSGSSGTATASDRGRAFRTPINHGRKRCTGDGDEDDEGDFSASNMMGMMMVQQRSEQSSREAELALWQEEMAMRRDKMTSQVQIQREESRAHQQMMIVMLMAMMQNIGGSNQQQRTEIVSGVGTDISGTNEQQNSDINK